jgi:Tfp pilus assembly protein PilV
MHRQRGASLVEALIAFVVLSLGLVAMARLQNHLRLNADIARQRSEAVRLAQEDIESLRAFAAVGAAPGVRSYADIAEATRTENGETGYHGNASYELARAVADHDDLDHKSAAVTVRWSDRSGQVQQVLLQSVIAASHPALSGALTVQAAVQPLNRVFGRSALIPPTAKDLGNGSSAFKPAASGGIAFVFDNITGEVTSRCDVATTVRTADLTLAQLDDCTAIGGLLLSGAVRFSLSAPPDAAQPNDAALPLAVSLSLSVGTDPECFTEAQQRVVTYHCVMTPVQGRWSGRSTLVPEGWALGSSADEYRICRYSADQDGNGTVDRNAEHPDTYRDVDATLMQQNFLIIRGDQACPAAAAINVDGDGPRVYADIGTVQHQP